MNQALYCITQQEVMCTLLIKINHDVDVVTKIPNLIKVNLFVVLEQHKTGYGDIGYQNTVIWLSLGIVLKTVWELRAAFVRRRRRTFQGTQRKNGGRSCICCLCDSTKYQTARQGSICT